MGKQFLQPTTATTSDDKELTAHRTPQGWVISDGSGNDIVTVGFQRDGKIGLLFNDRTNNRLFLGIDNDNNPIGKLSQEGIDVFDATERQTVWNIQNNSFKINKADTVTFTVDGTTPQNKTVPHYLGFSPIPLVFLAIGSPVIYQPLPMFTATNNFTVSGVQYVGFETWFYPTVDETNLYITLLNPGGLQVGIDYDLRYYLLQETAA